MKSGLFISRVRTVVAGVGVWAASMSGADASAANFTRVASDVSALPAERRFVANVLEARIKERLQNEADAKGAALTVAYRLDPSLGGETAKVAVKGSRVEIAAARPRALFYGIARLMEEMRWSPTSFALEDGVWTVRPVKPIRLAYWARHFHNWYHMASADELKRYAEDMMLMGVNGFKYQYVYPSVNKAGARADEIVAFERISKEVYAHLQAMDADFLLGGGGNQVPSDTPEELRGAPETDEMRGNLGFNACPAKPKALELMLKLRRQALDGLVRDGVKPGWFLHWPFDEGGCECDACRPWGGNGFIGLCKRYDAMNKVTFPGVKTVLSTWVFHDDDYDGLWNYLAKSESKWIDGLMIDSHGDFPKYALEHPLPRKLPVITFPEISMYRRWPWGGYGAIAMPARFERLFRQCEKVADGFMFYSEGLSEDVNKFLVARIYSEPTSSWQAAMRAYARLFLPGIAPEDFVRYCAMLEESHEFPIQATQFGGEPPTEEFFATCGPRTREIAAFAEKLDRDLLPSVRTTWRWRQLKLRADIDAHAANSRKLMTPAYERMARELIEMYHVDPEDGHYEDYTNHRAVRPYLPNVRLEGRPGETVEYRVRRTNRTDHDVVVKPAAKCVPRSFVGEAGVVLADGSVDWNGTKTLKPGESAVLAGRIRIPLDAKAGHYGGNVIFPHGREKGGEYWWISLEVLPQTAGGFGAQCAKRRWVTYRSFNKELERTGQFAAMGVTNRCFFAANTINALGRPYCQYPLIWKGFGDYDWSALDAQVGDLVKASPDARFLCMIDLNTPYWATHKFWLDSFTDVTHAACDADWRSRTEKWMLDFIACAERRWGDRIGAYILSGGGTSEWYEYDRGRTSAKKDAAWTAWCRARGLDYGDSVPPRPQLAKAAFENLVYDPAVEPEKVAYWKFHNSLPADTLLGFAKAARAAVPKSKEIGAFFGYFFVSDVKHTSFGHLDYERVYASPDIDFFIAPGNYSEREIGGGAGSQLVDGTALRYGKRFLHEIDFGPHDQSTWGGGLWKTLADDLAGNTREAAFAMAKNASYWWFDMWGEFYRNPKVRERIAALKRVQDALPDAPSVAEVLLVADPDSIYYVNERCPEALAFNQSMRNALAKTGAPYDTCSFGDLGAIDLSRYRMIVLNSTLLITPEREKLLREKVFTKGRTVVWTYAPGLVDGKALDVGRVKRFAGVAYRTPGVSVTMMGGWQAVYAHDYRLYTPEKLAQVERFAGVHRYVDACTPVFAKENFLAVHTVRGGQMAVKLPKRAGRVVDLLTGETVARDADSFEADFATPDTRLFGICGASPR